MHLFQLDGSRIKKEITELSINSLIVVLKIFKNLCYKITARKIEKAEKRMEEKVNSVGKKKNSNIAVLGLKPSERMNKKCFSYILRSAIYLLDLVGPEVYIQFHFFLQT